MFLMLATISLACDRLANGRLGYNRAKTKGRRDDEAFISVGIEPEALHIINKYRGIKKVFKFYRLYSDFRTFNRSANEGLRQIADTLNLPDLTSYYARHSWGTLARNVCGIHKEDIAMALNHVDSANKITDIYIEKDWTLIDKMNRKVLDLLK